MSTNIAALNSKKLPQYAAICSRLQQLDLILVNTCLVLRAGAKKPSLILSLCLPLPPLRYISELVAIIQPSQHSHLDASN
jgi:hypothetical protein